MTTAPVDGAQSLITAVQTGSRFRDREAFTAWLMILPSLFGLVVFYLLPAVRAIGISMSDWNLMSPPRDVGFDNYRAMLADGEFWHALKLSACYVIFNIPMQTATGLLLAVLMDRLSRAIVIRAIVLLPFLLSNVLVALIWVWLLDPMLGWVNATLQSVGANTHTFFSSPLEALATVAAVNTWRYTGMVSLLFLAGMQRIPRSLYEAAILDGVSEWRIFFRITLPLLRPVTLFVLVTSITGAFQIFDTIAVATSGGPAGSTRVIVYYIYENAFKYHKMGYACAMSITLLVLMMLYTAAQMWLFRANESDLALFSFDADTAHNAVGGAARSLKGVGGGRLFAWCALAIMIVGALIPFWIVLRTAVTPPADLYASMGSWLPSVFTLENFRRALGWVSNDAALAAGGSGGNVNFLRALLNSVIFSGLVVAGQVIFSSMAAYAFARLRFRGREPIFALFLVSLMLPNIILFIPNFVLVKELGWLNTYAGMVAPFLLVWAFAVFYLRQTFLSIPRELEEAARLDGASYWTIFWRVVVPLSVPPIATVAILSGVNAWNEFFWPFIVANADEVQVLTVALQTFKSQAPQGAPDWTGLMAATCLAIVPTLALLLFLGRYVVQSVQSIGGK
ncbi:ABC transporter permease subunit [Paraburkholderia sp. C35]|uniref:ABC transporter permease n=1 Tax=Paraburkholderia sp. C35 TaxID=2126993 RepID=UPI001EF68BF9|nr:ABC transporter permease subunit [Paraburkholderia sp. C35]